MNRFRYLHSLWLALCVWLRPPRFAKYRPAPRLDTRRVEGRVLRRIHWQMVGDRS